jgi:hypothetical protein
MVMTARFGSGLAYLRREYGGLQFGSGARASQRERDAGPVFRPEVMV